MSRANCFGYVATAAVPPHNPWTPKRKAADACPGEPLNKLWGSPQASEVGGVKYIGLSLPFTSPCLSPIRSLRVSVERSHILHLCEATTRRSTWHLILRTTSRVKFDIIQPVAILIVLLGGTYPLTSVTGKLCSLCVLDNCSRVEEKRKKSDSCPSYHLRVYMYLNWDTMQLLT